MDVELVKAEDVRELEEYWGIDRKKIWALKELFEKIKEKYPNISGTRSEFESLGDELLGAWDELTIFNIPILRNGNGLDIVLTTDTGSVVGHGKFDEKLKNVPMIGMDYYLIEVDRENK